MIFHKQAWLCVTCLFLSFTLTACTGETSESEKLDYSAIPLLGLTIQAEISESENFIPANLNGFFIADNGDLLITQRSSPSIHQFSQDGDYIKQVARDGSGPGELSNWFNPRFDGHTLTASNNPGQNFTLFEPGADGIYEYSTSINVRYPGSFAGIRGQNENISFYTNENKELQRLGVPDEFTTSYIHIFTVSNREEISARDSVLALQNHSHYIESFDGGGIRIQYLPYRYTDTFQPLPEQRLLVARPDSQLIRILNADFETEHQLQLNVQNREITATDLDYHIGDHSTSAQREMRELIKDIKPPFMDVYMDDSKRFWLQVDEAEYGTEYVILEYNGAPLGRLKLPQHQSLEMVRGNQLYVLNQPYDDVPAAIVYHVEI